MAEPIDRRTIVDVPLNQLRVLDAVFEEGSVRRAADRLFLTPSAVSHALRGLRESIGDELFIRQRDGMRPTGRTIEIMPRLREALRMLDDALGTATFDPATSERQFRIACLPFMSASICPGLAAMLGAAAPSIGVRVQLIDSALVQDLQHGRVDLAIAPVERMPPWVSSELLIDEEMVFVLRGDHPRGNAPLTLADLAALHHVEIQIGDQAAHAASVYRIDDGLEWAVNAIDRTVLSRALATQGLRRKIAMTVPDTITALAIAAQSDMIALCVRQAAEEFSRARPLILLDPPYPAPTTPLRMVWSARDDKDPGHRWLRERIIEQVRNVRPA